MEKKEINFIGTGLHQAINTIEHLTERFIALLIDLRKAKEREAMFLVRYQEIESTSLFEKVVYFLVFFLLPVLILFDYATLKNFIDFIHSRFSGLLADIVTYTGVFVFISLEILSGVRLVLQSQKVQKEGEVSNAYQVITYGLVFMAIIIPSMIIMAEYQLKEQTGENRMKMQVLVVVSLVIHIVFFASVDKLLQAFTYLYFKLKQYFFESPKTERAIKGLKPHLRKAYREYDRLLYLYLKLPEEERQINHRLGKKEQSLRDRLTNTVSSYEQDFVLLVAEELPQKQNTQRLN